MPGPPDEDLISLKREILIAIREGDVSGASDALLEVWAHHGIIGGNNGELIHMTADSTNSTNTQSFLQQFLHITDAPVNDIVIVADNLSSHKSKSTREFIQEHKIQVLHLNLI